MSASERPPVVHHAKRYCPCCGRVLDRVMRTNPESPYTMCVFCLAPLRFPATEAIFFERVDLATLPEEDQRAFETTRQLVLDAQRIAKERREALH